MSSIPALVGIHFAGLPVRFAIGRWSNLPTSTLITYNPADLTLNLLVRGIIHYIKKSHRLTFTPWQGVGLVLLARTLTIIGAWHATSLQEKPMPLFYATLVSFSSFLTIILIMELAHRFCVDESKKGENP